MCVWGGGKPIIGVRPRHGSRSTLDALSIFKFSKNMHDGKRHFDVLMSIHIYADQEWSVLHASVKIPLQLFFRLNNIIPV